MDCAGDSGSRVEKRCRVILTANVVLLVLVLKTTNTVRVVVKSKGEDIQPIAIGYIVEPAFDWNTLPDGGRRYGRVVEMKSWGSQTTDAKDAVAVVWLNEEFKSAAAAAQPKIYRWGTLALNGERMYDVRLCQTH